MKKSLNKNVHYVELSLPASGVISAPVVANVSMVGDLMTRINMIALGTAPVTVYARFLDVEHQIAPVSGYMLVTNAWNDVKLDREIEGPPWVLEIQAYNPGGAAAVLYVLAEIGDSKEKDIDALILAQLEALNAKFAK